MANHACNQGERFDRLEGKLDTLIELQVTNARIEEQVASVFRIVNDHEERLRIVEKSSDQNTWLSARSERLFWIIVAAAVGGIGYIIRGGG